MNLPITWIDLGDGFTMTSKGTVFTAEQTYYFLNLERSIHYVQSRLDRYNAINRGYLCAP